MKQQVLYFNSTKKVQKKKHEFMQKVIISSFVFALLWVTNSYVMAWFDKINPLETLSGIVISTPIASIVGYALQNCVRAKWFKDKTANDEPLNNQTTGGNKRGT